MEPRPPPTPPSSTPPQSSVPAVRSQVPVPAVPVPTVPEPPPDPDAGSSEPPSTPTWRRITRTRRGAAGLAIATAALLLWPFAGWSWLPWLAGLGVLLLLRLLRLDGLLRGWAPHLAGMVVVAGLMVSTGPWSWALAASIGVLLAGLVQLPWWRLAAVGAAMCAVSGVGFVFSVQQSAEVARQIQEQQSEQSFSLLGERSPERVLPALLEGIGQNDVVAVCGLLDSPARTQFVAAAAAPDCRAAVTAFHSALASPPRIRDLDASTTPAGPGWVTDGCRTAWAAAPLGGPTLGRLDVRRSEPPGRTYFVAGFRPC